MKTLLNGMLRGMLMFEAVIRTILYIIGIMIFGVCFSITLLCGCLTPYIPYFVVAFIILALTPWSLQKLEYKKIRQYFRENTIYELINK